MKRSKLNKVFEDCKKNNILVNLDSNCFTTSAFRPIKYKKESTIGCIYADTNNNMRIMRDLLDEGSASVEWIFVPRKKELLNKLGLTIVKIFSENGYYTSWRTNDQPIIFTVITKEDLPEIKTFKVFPKIGPESKLDEPNINTTDDENNEIIEPKVPKISNKKQLKKKIKKNCIKELKETEEKTETESENN